MYEEIKTGEAVVVGTAASHYRAVAHGPARIRPGGWIKVARRCGNGITRVEDARFIRRAE